MKYYFIELSEKKGPISVEEFSGFNISKDTILWRKGLDNWTRADEIEELIEYFKSLPPSIPSDIIIKGKKKVVIEIKKNNQKNHLLFERFKIRIAKSIVFCFKTALFFFISINIVFLFLMFKFQFNENKRHSLKNKEFDSLLCSYNCTKKNNYVNFSFGYDHAYEIDYNIEYNDYENCSYDFHKYNGDKVSIINNIKKRYYSELKKLSNPILYSQNDFEEIYNQLVCNKKENYNIYHQPVTISALIFNEYNFWGWKDNCLNHFKYKNGLFGYWLSFSVLFILLRCFYEIIKWIIKKSKQTLIK